MFYITKDIGSALPLIASDGLKEKDLFGDFF